MESEYVEVGKLGKPHGVNGEINAVFDEGVTPIGGDCLMLEMDGLMVPFFVTSARPKGRESWLLRLEGIDSEERVKQMVNKTVSMASSRLPQEEADPDNIYLCDLVGFEVYDPQGTNHGRIESIDEQTANVLFVISDGLMVPAVDDFIEDIDVENKKITLLINDELRNLNKG